MAGCNKLFGKVCSIAIFQAHGKIRSLPFEERLRMMFAGAGCRLVVWLAHWQGCKLLALQVLNVGMYTPHLFLALCICFRFLHLIAVELLAHYFPTVFWETNFRASIDSPCVHSIMDFWTILIDWYSWSFAFIIYKKL